MLEFNIQSNLLVISDDICLTYSCLLFDQTAADRNSQCRLQWGKNELFTARKRNGKGSSNLLICHGSRALVSPILRRCHGKGAWHKSRDLKAWGVSRLSGLQSCISQTTAFHQFIPVSSPVTVCDWRLSFKKMSSLHLKTLSNYKMYLFPW